MTKQERKSGMYGEMPIVKIGRFNICMMSDDENEVRVWLQDGEDEAMEVQPALIKDLEKVLEAWFNKHF